MEGRKIVFLISPEYWGNNFVSKHHYANYLSAKYLVYFIQPPSKWSFKNIFSTNIETKAINPNLLLVEMANILPRLNYLPKFVQDILFKIQAKRILGALKIKNPFIVWSFTPMVYWNLNIWNATKKIYHTVDFHPAKFEKHTCESADIVVSVTDLVSQPILQYKPIIYNLGHGADIDSFVKANLNEVVLPGANRIKAGYVGNFHNQINYDLLKHLALRNLNIDFIMVGPYGKSNLSHFNTISNEDFEELKAMKNVFFIGSVPSNKLMSYLLHFDINLVLFKDDKKIIHCNPHKMMGYFYAGGITVSNFLDEYKDKRHLLLMADEEKEIEGLFKYAAENLEDLNSEEKKLRRRKFAEANSYALKIEEIENLLAMP